MPSIPRRTLRAAVLALIVIALPWPAFAARDTGARGEESLRHYLYGRWLELDGRFDDAAVEYFRSLSLDPESVELRVTLASLHARMGEPERSLELAEQAVRRDSSHARARWLQGAALFNLRRLDEALPALRTAALLDSSDLEILRTYAHAAEVADRIELVEGAYARITTLEPEDPEAWFQLASAQARRGRFAAAEQSLTRSRARQPARPGGEFLAAWIHESLGRADTAIVEYRRHLVAHPQDATSRRRLALLLARAGRGAEAWVEAERLVRQLPSDPDALLLGAECAFSAGQADEGNRLLTRLRSLGPDALAFTERSIMVLARHGRRDDAVALADTWAARHTAGLAGPLLAARARAMAGDLGGAIARTRAMVASAPDSLAPRELLARVLADSGQWREAAAAWGDLLDRAPDRIGVRLERAHALDQAGLPDSAAAEARRVLVHRPDHAPALNFIGYMWAERDRNLDEAQRLLERALELDPDNGAYVDSWGWLLFRLGRLTEARTHLERALVLTGGDPVIHEHLGDVLVALDDRAAARQQYRRSLELDRDNARVRRKLDGLR